MAEVRPATPRDRLGQARPFRAGHGPHLARQDLKPISALGAKWGAERPGTSSSPAGMEVLMDVSWRLMQGRKAQQADETQTEP